MGLNVNMNTERYQREDISAPYSSNHLLSQPGNVAYGIWTANCRKPSWTRGTSGIRSAWITPCPRLPDELVAMWDAGVETGAYFKADTLDDLAKQLGLDAAALKRWSRATTSWCDKGVDEDF